MPELPDLVYIVKRLAPEITGRLITAVTVKQPIVIRMMTGGSFAETLSGRRLLSLERRGPFLVFTADGNAATAASTTATTPRYASGLSFTLELLVAEDQPVTHRFNLART